MKTINQKQTGNKKSKSVRSAVQLLFWLLLLSLALFIYRDSFRDIMAGLRQVTWLHILISVLLSIAYYILEGITIHSMASMIVLQDSVWNGIAIAFQCEFYRLITLGSGAGIAEIHYLHKNGIEPARGTMLTMLQYIMKKTGIMVLGVLGFAGLYRNENTINVCEQYAGFLGAGCVITVIIVLFLLFIALSPSVMLWVIWIMDKITQRVPSLSEKTNFLKEQMTALNQTGKIIFCQKKRLAWIILLNLIKLAAMYCIPAYLLYGKSQLTPAECFMLMAVVYMLSGVIPAPSGVGSLEFVFLLFFGVFADSSVVVPAVLVFRFATWILPFAIGGVLLLINKISKYTARIS